MHTSLENPPVSGRLKQLYLPLRILHITPYYPPDVVFGGPVSSVSALCEALSQAGVEVTVYTIAYAGAPPRTVTMKGVIVHYFKGDFGEPCQVSRALWNATRANAGNFDVVHLHTWWNILIFRALYILRLQKAKCILSARGMLSDYSFNHRKTRIKKVFQQTMGVSLLKGVGLQATSEAEAEEMSRRASRPLDEVDIIPNLLSLTAAQKYKGPPTGFVLGLLSRLHHKKGIDLLLEAVAQVPEVTELVFGGTGDPEYEEWMRSEINRLGIAHKVRFAGWIADADKPAFFDSIHVFILPSYNENFANVVAEAWSMAKPVIVSSGVGLQHFLADYDAGWICESTVESVADTIRTACGQRERWPEMGQAALQLVRDELNGPQLVQAYITMYEQNAYEPSLPHLVKPDSYILGINAFHSDASAALFHNGLLVAAAEEERFVRVKHWAGFPKKSVEYCLAHAGISILDVDTVAVGRDPRAKWDRKVRFLTNNPRAISFALRGRLSNASRIKSVSDSIATNFMVNKEAIQHKIAYVEHHRSHLASSFYSSPFSDAALLSVDGSGDFTTTMMAIGKGNKIEVLQSVDFPHSIGIFYTAFTQLLGFPHYGDEYKVMGLSPYGVPRFAKQLEAVIQPLPDGLFRLDLSWFRSGAEGFVYYSSEQQPMVPELFTPRLTALFGEPRAHGEPITQFHMDLAASVQHTVEQIIFHMLRHLHLRTGLKKLCLSGGVAQNSVANGKITMQTPFEEVYVPPAGHDAGLALGAAQWVYHQVLGGQRTPPLLHAFTGLNFSSDKIEKALKGQPVHFVRMDNFDLLCKKVAAVIKEGGVVGWFRGRAEFGPRALGNRSILADPRRSDAKDLLNYKIKRREPFRPFAPAILEEYTGEYFMLNESTPFMERVLPIRPEKQQEIPAVTHVDGTGRLQTVSQVIHPHFYKLIDAFRQITGVPILLNTSFNENEPIVNTPAEAIACFLRTRMDMLVLEDVVVSRD